MSKAGRYCWFQVSRVEAEGCKPVAYEIRRARVCPDGTDPSWRYHANYRDNIARSVRARLAIVVVGSFTLKGKDTQPGDCLADIGKTIGFEIPKIGIRNLHRDNWTVTIYIKKSIKTQKVLPQL